MRIGISCLQIDSVYAGGVNTYTLGLLEGFATLSGSNCFRLYVTEENRHLFEKFQLRGRFELAVTGNGFLAAKKSVCRAALLSGSKAFYKLTSNIVLKDIRRKIESEVDILYVPTVVLPFFNAQKPTVLSMHDIQHVHYPEFFNWPRRLSRRITYGLSARHANCLQASSNFIKEDLLRHFSEIRPEQIEIIPEGVNIAEFASPADGDGRLERYLLPEKFLFFPAQLWPHKNHLTVLKALKQIENRHGIKIPLVLTGAKFSAAFRIFEFISDQSMGYVHYLGKVPFPDLVGLYKKAAFLISPSLYEANSLPVLEAAAAGTPIIASRIPPNEELGEALQLNLFDPLDAGKLACLIVALWKDEETASAQVAHNLEHISRYSWKNAAQRYMQLFERILNS